MAYAVLLPLSVAPAFNLARSNGFIILIVLELDIQTLTVFDKSHLSLTRLSANTDAKNSVENNESNTDTSLLYATPLSNKVYNTTWVSSGANVYIYYYNISLAWSL